MTLPPPSMYAPTSPDTPMTPRQRARDALKPLFDRPLFSAEIAACDAVEAAIRDAERAAIERAARAIQCSNYDEGWVCYEGDCCAPNARAILALIDKEPI